ncbi:MAG: GNAT family N-acetyltransferase [Myxococcales bacterium]|nr:GNAT family N-acetyltransferase [Myxococcales bacterium]
MSTHPEEAPSPYEGTREQAWKLLSTADYVRFSASVDGQQVVRCFNVAVVDGTLCFHGGRRGGKQALIGATVLASAEEVVAQVPSYWVDPVMACPASTYYLSAQAAGTVRPITDLHGKARVLSALMQRFQPEGGYAAIDPNDRKYAAVLERLTVAAFVPERMQARNKLGQKRSAAQIERVLEGLWQRGQSGDLRAIRLVQEAHPARPRPAFMRGPADTGLCVNPNADDARQVAALLEGQYWTEGYESSRRVAAHLSSSAWLVARSREGEVVASARAVSDGARYAWILDVVVRSDHRGRGIGRFVTQRLLEHPRLAQVQNVGLATRDAQAFYGRLGFAPKGKGADETLRLVRVEG